MVKSTHLDPHQYLFSIPTFSQLTQRGFVIVLVLQIIVLSGCGQYKKLTNDVPQITSFTVPLEVAYGETVEFRVRVFDPEEDPMKPIVDAVALEHRKTFIIGRLDIDENRQTTGEYKVNGIPTYLVF